MQFEIKLPAVLKTESEWPISLWWSSKNEDSPATYVHNRIEFLTFSAVSVSTDAQG